MERSRWRLDGQLALVTGGSAGIGAAIVRMLLDAGHKVVNIDYRLPDSEDLLQLPAARDGEAALEAAVAALLRRCVLGVQRRGEAVQRSCLPLLQLQFQLPDLLGRLAPEALRVADRSGVCLFVWTAHGLPYRTDIVTVVIGRGE